MTAELRIPRIALIVATVVVGTPARAAPPEPASASTAAFRHSLHAMLPLSPQQIQEFKHRADATRRAIHAGPQPQLQSSSRVLDLAPGAPLPVITVAPNYVSSVVFVDDTGAPWPITSYAVGAPSWFSVTQPKIAPANMLTIAPTGSYVSSDLAVTLQGYATPVVLDLKTSSTRAAALIALRANLPGPNAAPAVFAATARPTANRVLLSFLDDTPPHGATALDASMRGVQAWDYQHSVYVRTRYTAVWPAWSAHTRGAGGVNIYSLPPTSSIMVTIDGQSRTISLTHTGGNHG